MCVGWLIDCLIDDDCPFRLAGLCHCCCVDLAVAANRTHVANGGEIYSFVRYWWQQLCRTRCGAPSVTCFDAYFLDFGTSFSLEFVVYNTPRTDLYEYHITSAIAVFPACNMLCNAVEQYVRTAFEGGSRQRSTLRTWHHLGNRDLIFFGPIVLRET